MLTPTLSKDKPAWYSSNKMYKKALDWAGTENSCAWNNPAQCQTLFKIKCCHNMTQKDCTKSDCRLIRSLWHPGWRQWFPNTAYVACSETTGSHFVVPGLCLQHPSCGCTLKPHTRALVDAISIFHGRGVLKSTGLRISALCSLHYSLSSLAALLICVDKGLDGRLRFGLRCSHSTIFTLFVGYAEMEWHHSSIFMLNHLYSAGLEVDLHLNLFPAHIIYTSIVHADYDGPNVKWEEHTVWRGVCLVTFIYLCIYFNWDI